MLNTIQGTYSNGVVVLDEQPPVTDTYKVLVTFTERTTTDELPAQPRKAGFGKGTILYMAPDFDDPIDDHFDCLK
jgi:hypothetical protein